MPILDGPTWLKVTNWFNIICFSTSIPINFFLLYCVVTQSGRNIGDYKTLLIWFAVHCMAFPAVNLITNMNFYTHEATLFILTVANRFNFPCLGVWMLLATNWICCGYSILSLNAQFAFRWIVMSNSGKNLFWRFRKEIFLNVLLGVTGFYSFSGFLGIQLTPAKDLAIQETLADAYNVTPDNVYYIAVQYFDRDAHNVKVYDTISFTVAIGNILIFFGMVVFIFVCGVRTFFAAQRNTAELLNHKQLQKDLTIALLIQTVVPSLLIFLPCAIFYLLPLFEQPLGVDANILLIAMDIFSNVGPISILFTFKNYRLYILKLCRRKIAQKIRCSVIEMTTVTENRVYAQNYSDWDIRFDMI
ncbi:Seven TM Receptor [Caenorhabditis elegans]|uniref:Seven TM Receptor n=1 Tax=Caenorhabditis elegans TaxID=6239 RepID=Q9TXM5_CAEEL|nr:Seven TM Receptor [Caenorhabditis elegans]CCD71649.2 Seven TM Receptor [Caenorhabditis elegans]